ncbi:MAG TPA: IS110 family transposase [Cellvibrio sp.]
MNITRMGIDLAKNVFQLHGVDTHERVVIRKQLKRSQLLSFFVNKPSMLIGMEACGGAHHWARELTRMGHTVKLMPPQHVKAYVKSQKNDQRDAEAICEAVSRPTMRFVEIKSIEQQDMQAIHRVRERLIKARTALSNEMRGLLAEYGVILGYTGIPATQRGVRSAIEDADNGLSHSMRELLCEMSDELTDFNAKIQKCDIKIQRHAQEDERVRRLLAIEGIGPISASAIVTAIGNGTQFKNGRELAAWLGLVPNQHSSGGKDRLGGISKRGDKRLRTLIIHGARAVIRFCETKLDTRSQWIKSLIARRNKNIATVGLANKNARIIWSLLARNEVYRPAAM